MYVQTEVTALSTGTDLGNYLGKSTDIPGAPDYPRAVGYSNVGIVRAVGSQVGNLRNRAARFLAKAASVRIHRAGFRSVGAGS